MEFEPVIGLEVHAQLKTTSKIFCSCSTEYGAPPNTHTCPICLGMPGVLPVLNKKVVEYTLRMGIATACEIAQNSRFARKNYFYPDLPKGYQISQYELPIAIDGFIIVTVSGKEKKIGITRIHMEEDAGKLTHDPGRPISRIDYNRTGVPLMEIVSEPDIRSPEEAGAYLRQLRSIVRYIDVCDGNMEQGSFRCDANVSIRRRGSEKLGVRTEIKNLNSFRHVEKAIYYEIIRQKEVLLDGGKILQETLLWDPDNHKTISIREKEEAHDYRYFPDPDLLPLVIDDAWIYAVSKNLPELPAAKRKRLIDSFGLTPDEADLLTSSRELADFFEACMANFPNAKQVCNWISGSLLGFLNANGKSITQSPISPNHLAGLLSLIDNGVISSKMAKTVFTEMAETGRSSKDIVTEKGLVQVTDVSVIEGIVSKILALHPKQVVDYRSGKTKILGFFVGRVMKETHGKANPKIVNDVLIKKLVNM